MFNANNRPGQLFQNHYRRVMQRKGSAVVLGEVLAFDMLGTATETAAGQGVFGATGLDVQDAIFHNAVPVAEGNLDGLMLLVTDLLSGAGADNTEIVGCICGQRIQALVNGGTIDIVVGDRLSTVAASTTLLSMTTTEIVDTRSLGYALEGHTADTNVLKDVVWWGGLPFSGLRGTTP